MDNLIFTIGHSTYDVEHFADLLSQYTITTVCDVRSLPYSRRNPQFNSKEIKNFLFGCGISYEFLGRELGARSDDPSCYVNGKVQYGRLAKTDLFQGGLQWVSERMSKQRIALMCAERDPIECHRAILVGRYLIARGIDVTHILENGQSESQASVLDRLLSSLYKDLGTDLFRSRADMIEDAYEIQSSRIAFQTNKDNQEAEAWSHLG